MSDGLSTLYQDLLNGSYDCVDRIVLNAYFRMGHSSGGFRVWWRALTGSDETLENAYLMRLAGRFSRRVRGYAKAHNIAVIDCSVGSASTTLPQNIAPRPPSCRAYFWSWLVERRRRFGMSAPNTTSNERRRSRTSTTTRFISWTANGVISPSKSAGILPSRPR